MGDLELPAAPAHLAGPVKSWRQAVVIPTYRPLPPDRNPMFLDRRVYQGSSGRVYPLPFTDRISEQRVDQSWDAIHLENEYLRLMILPQLGGRIHVGLDKTNGYDFFYRQDVIKPALVGLAGPWISGGVEFNWPQHHRPSTFMPVDAQIETHDDGSVTVWCSEHEPMNRMKGMHGVCLHPGKSLVELKVRLYNRTELVQTFLWWANVAARVHERYQSFFPTDVTFVADHAKRAMSRFPLCDGSYYGVYYNGRAKQGVPDSERPAQFLPPNGLYPLNDLSWYANIPVPTSYMAIGSREDFFGGYDLARQAGLVHVANHHIAPGKKQWTWGNHDFGYAWDRNLTDADGPYIELMAGVYTDNQPDFSFLHPGETRTFSQFWYPIEKIGPAQKANLEAAISLQVQGKRALIGVAVTAPIPKARIALTRGDRTVWEMRQDLSPGQPLVNDVSLTSEARSEEFRLDVQDSAGRTVIEYAPISRAVADIPLPATEPPLPENAKTNDELYLTGLHLEQYRHATRRSEDYWREALRRDPHDSRAGNALGLWHLRRGEFQEAAEHFQRARKSLTRRNPNPYDGEPFYNLGLALRYMGRDDDAYDAFYKATWNYAWQSPAFYALAQIDCCRHDWQSAIEHLNRSLRVNIEHLQVRDLKAAVLRKLGQTAAADKLLSETLQLDLLDHWARHLSGMPLECDTQVRLDLAIDFAKAGQLDDAIENLVAAAKETNSGAAPLVQYYLAYLYQRKGDLAASHAARLAAQTLPRDYCFPARLEDIAILQAAIDADPADAAARYYLGNLYYDRRRHSEAIELWEASAKIDSEFATVWRNLGLAYFNVADDPQRARDAYDRALAADPTDARVFYERDQLWKRIGESPEKRLVELEGQLPLVNQRDDLSIELCALYNQTGRHERALAVLQARRFQPWEGGEGLALAQHVRTHLALGRLALDRGDALQARQMFEAALASPENLGEAKHLLANQSDVHYWLGMACDAAGDVTAAKKHWQAAADFRGDFQEMTVRKFSALSYYSALAMRALGRAVQADQLLREMEQFADKLERQPATVDYFATSLPAMLLFKDDLQLRQRIQAKLLKAQSLLGLGERDAAIALLNEVVELDRNQADAADLLASLQGLSNKPLHPPSTHKEDICDSRLPARPC